MHCEVASSAPIAGEQLQVSQHCGSIGIPAFLTGPVIAVVFAQITAMAAAGGAAERGALKGDYMTKRVEPVRRPISTLMPAGILMFAMQLFGQTSGPLPADRFETSVTHEEQRQMESSDGPTSIR